jgi:hypothetical protein
MTNTFFTPAGPAAGFSMMLAGREFRLKQSDNN